MATQVVEAVFQDGAFRPTRPVSSAIVEGQHVRLVVEVEAAPDVLALATAAYEGLSEAEVAEIESHRLRGARGKTLLQFAGAMEKSDVEIMARAIEEGCEKADADGW